MDWFAATDVPADVFGEGAKGDKVGIQKTTTVRRMLQLDCVMLVSVHTQRILSLRSYR